jgi:hypothetical protein
VWSTDVICEIFVVVDEFLEGLFGVTLDLGDVHRIRLEVVFVFDLLLVDTDASHRFIYYIGVGVGVGGGVGVLELKINMDHFFFL